LRFRRASAAATTAAATTEEGLQGSAGTAAAAVGKINAVAACRKPLRRRDVPARPHRKRALLIHRIADIALYGEKTTFLVVIAIETIR
jgi:hypothetical protein